MHPNIAELASEELAQIRNKLNLVTELLQHYVSDQKHPVYKLLQEANGTVEKAESEIRKLKGETGSPNP